MHKLYELKDKLIQELEDYSENGKYSKEDVELIKYMASAVDHLCNIMEGEEEYSMAMDGGSYEGNMMYGGSYARGGRGRSYARGGSYARGRGRNARRDSMGRYSREGYSRAADDFKMELQEIMQDAPNEQVKMEIQHVINRMGEM